MNIERAVDDQAITAGFAELKRRSEAEPGREFWLVEVKQYDGQWTGNQLPDYEVIPAMAPKPGNRTIVSNRFAWPSSNQ